MWWGYEVRNQMAENSSRGPQVSGCCYNIWALRAQRCLRVDEELPTLKIVPVVHSVHWWWSAAAIATRTWQAKLIVRNKRLLCSYSSIHIIIPESKWYSVNLQHCHVCQCSINGPILAFNQEYYKMSFSLSMILHRRIMTHSQTSAMQWDDRKHCFDPFLLKTLWSD